ncbi:transporter substrate-binding domain-containing protein [Bdellovibrio sp. 22V]|uniref:substrate-binding periplasmic protein n=1 Tax=Bdellovibrio TaxID=958 RepID=UPI002543DD6E|nr:transporter substrate-binding domain-containing protein [Bdellovibrio sp. 22V]WII73134.1 transporter substrate-binding domain-containing protein [Bdellovibrio sp. 22V]
MKAIWVLILIVLHTLLSFAETSTTTETPLKDITFITMEIPPFMSESMPEQGAATYAMKETFKKLGYNFKVRFVPIMRTRTVGFDPSVTGFFPSFKDDDFLRGMVLSKTVYDTPWVIVERKDKPIHWEKPEDLAKYKGGNVNGYTIRSLLRTVHKQKKLNLETAPNDALNVLKLANKRVDYIFIDAGVFKFLAAADPRVKQVADSLQINPKIVMMNHYGAAFKTDPANQKIMEEFNKHADSTEFTLLVEKYFREKMK